MLPAVLSVVVRAVARILYGTKHLGAVAVIRSGDGAQVVLVRKPGDLWALPGGFCARREQPWRTAVREVREETGLEISVSRRPAGVVLRGSHVDLVFTAVHDPVGPLAAPRADNRVTAWLRNLDAATAQWFPLTGLPRLTTVAEQHLETVGSWPPQERI